MKNSKIVFSFFLALFLISFYSCENEPLDSDINSNETTDSDEIGESSGDYWPRAIGNTWNFDDTYYGNVTYNMVATEVIDGDTYYKFDDLFGQASWLKKVGDSYYVRNNLSGFPIEGYEVSTTIIELVLLKDSANIGEEWINNVNYTISYTPLAGGLPDIPNIDFSATYGFKMMERDITRTVEGVVYNNVLHVRLTLSAVGVPASNVDYFYAKDVGLIEFSGDQSSATLIEYNLN